MLLLALVFVVAFLGFRVAFSDWDKTRAQIDFAAAWYALVVVLAVLAFFMVRR